MKLPKGIGFTAKNFNLPYEYAKTVAEEANAALPALFEEWVKLQGVLVFGNSSEESMSFDWTVGINKDDTHQAYLVLVERIAK